jgi:uncharacterized membrane protein (DUF106 family)
MEIYSLADKVILSIPDYAPHIVIGCVVVALIEQMVHAYIADRARLQRIHDRADELRSSGEMVKPYTNRDIPQRVSPDYRDVWGYGIDNREGY